MKEISSNNFGLLIAFVLPGLTTLWGATYLSPVVRSWLAGADGAGPTVGGFLYVTLASLAAGLTVSTVRWAVIDTIHAWTGLPPPVWDFSRFQENVSGYEVLNEIHYKFYQFHANSLIAVLFVYVARRVHLGFWTVPIGWFDVGVALLATILFVGSRDTLRKYYRRVNDLLGQKENVANDQVDTTPTATPNDDSETCAKSA